MTIPKKCSDVIVNVISNISMTFLPFLKNFDTINWNIAKLFRVICFNFLKSHKFSKTRRTTDNDMATRLKTGNL